MRICWLALCLITFAAIADAEPALIVKNHPQLPLRQVAEWLGYDVDGSNNGVTCKKPGVEVWYRYGDDKAVRNGQTILLPMHGHFDCGNYRTYVPWEFVSTVLGAKVDGNDDLFAVYVHHPTSGKLLPCYIVNRSYLKGHPSGTAWQRFELQGKELLAAIQANDIPAVRSVLATMPAAVNYRGNDDQYPVGLAVKLGRKEIVALLMEHGAVPSLHVAAQSGQAEIVEMLLQYGVKRNPGDSRMCTPLARAVEKGKLNIVELLLANGADIETGSTSPMAMAVKGNDIHIAGVLLKAGAGLNHHGSQGETPLHHAVQYGQYDMVQFIVPQGAQVNALDEQWRTPLHLMNAEYWFFGTLPYPETMPYADTAEDDTDEWTIPATREVDYLGLTNYMLDNGADLTLLDKQGRTVLCVAVEENMCNVAEVLLKRGAAVNPKEEGARQPLDLVQSLPMATLLFNYGADPNAGSGLFSVTMRAGADEFATNLARLFLAHGAKVDTRLSDGATPLHRAASHGLAGVAGVLIEADAEVNVQDIHGETPLHHVGSSLATAKVTEVLLAHGADANAQAKDGQTPLHRTVRGEGCNNEDIRMYGAHAAKHDQPLVFPADLLLQHGANAGIADAKGVTPLHLAMQNPRWLLEGERFKLLLDHGADVNARDAEGKTPLHWLAEQSYEEMEQVAHLLIDAGAQANVRDNAGRTPLGIVTARHNAQLAESRRTLDPGANLSGLDGTTRIPLMTLFKEKGGKE